MPRSGAARLAQPLLIAAGFVVVVAGLWAGKSLFIPLILATLLSFLLAPVADRLERWRVPRVIAIVLATAMAFAVITVIGFIVVQQAVELVSSLPRYQRNIEQRVQEIEGRSSAVMRRLTENLQRFRIMDSEPQDEEPPPAGVAAPQVLEAEAAPLGSPDKPMTVRVEPEPLQPLALLRDYAGTVLSPLLTAGLVIIFVIFMLLQRDDLRDRVIGLIGQRRIYVTTHALGEAGRRISRYLLMQLIINLSYGVPVAAGLWFIGLPGAVLWGLLATLVRFIPYLGPWLGALLPIFMSLAVFPGWLYPLLVVGMFMALELFSNNVMEPWLYGATTGMSPMAVLVAATFWSWLWGPIGLLLAVPITACLVVAGQHIPPLRFLAVLLGDKVALAPHVRLYQRLAEMDSEKALTMVREHAREHSRLELYDELVLPALHLTEQERHRGWLDQDRQQFIRRSMQEAVDEVATVKMPEAGEGMPALRCVAARDVADALTALMLADLLRAHQLPAITATRTQLLSGVLAPSPAAPVVVICALPPSAAHEALDLLRALRQVEPRARVVIGLWRGRPPRRLTARVFRRHGAAAVVHRFADALPLVERMFAPPPDEPPDAGA